MTSTSSSTSTEPPAPSFVGTIEVIDNATAERMTSSWREGCPVSLEDLRLLRLRHWDFTGNVATGELVIHHAEAETVVGVFERLFTAGFPIERMELVDTYGGDDNVSMAANNTSAFNCREVAWKPGVWSNHAYGTAIDINPLVNPYVAANVVLPPEGEPFIDRSVTFVGGIYPGDEVVTAFAAVGWGWGGNWSSAKDWQHFSASGN